VAVLPLVFANGNDAVCHGNDRCLFNDACLVIAFNGYNPVGSDVDDADCCVWLSPMTPVSIASLLKLCISDILNGGNTLLLLLLLLLLPNTVPTLDSSAASNGVFDNDSELLDINPKDGCRCIRSSDACRWVLNLYPCACPGVLLPTVGRFPSVCSTCAVAAIAAENCCDSERSSRPGSVDPRNLLPAPDTAPLVVLLSCFISVSVSVVVALDDDEDEDVEWADALTSEVSFSPLIDGKKLLLSSLGNVDECNADANDTALLLLVFISASAVLSAADDCVLLFSSSDML